MSIHQNRLNDPEPPKPETFDVILYLDATAIRFYWRTRESADAFVDVLEMRDGTPANISGYDVEYE